MHNCLKDGEIQDGKTLGLSSENGGELVQVKQFCIPLKITMLNTSIYVLFTCYFAWFFSFFIFNFPLLSLYCYL